MEMYKKSDVEKARTNKLRRRKCTREVQKLFEDCPAWTTQGHYEDEAMTSDWGGNNSECVYKISKNWPPEEQIIDDLTELEHYFKWIMKVDGNSLSIRKNGVKGTATWDETGHKSRFVGLAVAAMKALGMTHEDIERMMEESKELLKKQK